MGRRLCSKSRFFRSNSLSGWSRMLRKSFEFLHKVERRVCRDLANSRRSFSQCGEDILVQYVFNMRKIHRPSYLDIGCNDPFVLNNTVALYLQGSRGINIDANPNLIRKFERERPQDINLNTGISGTDAGELDFYLMEDDTLSTFSKGECDALQGHGHKLRSVEKIRLTTISKILEKHAGGKFPDFLSLDVEGLDFEILKTIDFARSAPKVICVEAAEYSPTGSGERRSDLIEFLVAKGYYEYANTNLNAIMVQRTFWFI